MSNTPPTFTGIESDHEREADRLISILIDGEATEDDRQQFDRLAASEPTLWRQLALSQQDTVRLTESLRDVTASVERIELPRRWLALPGMSWTIALSGWAAVLIVAFSWILITTPGRPGASTESVAIDPVITNYTPALTAEEHLERYLRAPYVLGDLQPVVLEIEELSDGRVAVHFVRRIEEFAFIDPNLELPVDESGELTSDPALLRSREPHVGLPN